MLLTDYTTVDEVRATLGVSSTEITDAILLQTRWTFQASLALEDINADMPDMYTTVAAINANSRTKEQQRYYDLVRIFMCYSICQELVAALPMFSVQTLTDGKASFTRFAAAYAETIAANMGMFNSLRYRVGAAYVALVPGAIVSTSVTQTFTVASNIGVDPVTG